MPQETLPELSLDPLPTEGEFLEYWNMRRESMNAALATIDYQLTRLESLKLAADAAKKTPTSPGQSEDLAADGGAQDDRSPADEMTTPGDDDVSGAEADGDEQMEIGREHSEAQRQEEQVQQNSAAQSQEEQVEETPQETGGQHSEAESQEEHSPQHVDKMRKTAKGKVTTAASSLGPRRSNRSTAGPSPAAVLTPLKASEQPTPTPSMLRLLRSGTADSADAELVELGEEDGLSERRRGWLREWWAEWFGQTEKEKLSRFRAWFGGKAQDKCLGCQLFTKRPSRFQSGACRACLAAKRPCMALRRREGEHLVVVLPEAGREAGKEFKYWTEMKKE